jgi:hypothetical protein
MVSIDRHEPSEPDREYRQRGQRQLLLAETNQVDDVTGCLENIFCALFPESIWCKVEYSLVAYGRSLRPAGSQGEKREIFPVENNLTN